MVRAPEIKNCYIWKYHQRHIFIALFDYNNVNFDQLTTKRTTQGSLNTN